MIDFMMDDIVTNSRLSMPLADTISEYLNIARPSREVPYLRRKLKESFERTFMRKGRVFCSIY